MIKKDGLVKNKIVFFEKYKNYVIIHGCHLHNTSAEMAMAKMILCPSVHNALPHWKFMLHCCDKCTSIFIPSQESNRGTTNTFPTIRFHVYRKVSHCALHGRCTYKE